MLWIGEFLRPRNDVFVNRNKPIELNSNSDKSFRLSNAFVKKNPGKMSIFKNVNELIFEIDESGYPSC